MTQEIPGKNLVWMHPACLLFHLPVQKDCPALHLVLQECVMVMNTTLFSQVSRTSYTIQQFTKEVQA